MHLALWLAPEPADVPAGVAAARCTAAGAPRKCTGLPAPRSDGRGNLVLTSVVIIQPVRRSRACEISAGSLTRAATPLGGRAASAPAGFGAAACEPASGVPLLPLSPCQLPAILPGVPCWSAGGVAAPGAHAQPAGWAAWTLVPLPPPAAPHVSQPSAQLIASLQQAMHEPAVGVIAVSVCSCCCQRLVRGQDLLVCHRRDCVSCKGDIAQKLCCCAVQGKLPIGLQLDASAVLSKWGEEPSM